MAKGNVYQSYNVVCTGEKDVILKSSSFSKHKDALDIYNEYKKNIDNKTLAISMIGIKSDNTTKVMFKKEIKNRNLNYIDSNKSTHISEINPKNELKNILNSLDLLKKKLEFAEEAQNIYIKEQDCELHRIEELDMMEFESVEDEINYKLSIIDNIKEIRTKRRIVKNHAMECKEILNVLENFSFNNISALEMISNKQYTYKLEDGHTTKVYTYTYDTEEEKDKLLKQLKHQFSKVLNISEGVIKCYNNCRKNYIPQINTVSENYPNLAKEFNKAKNTSSNKKSTSQSSKIEVKTEPKKEVKIEVKKETKQQNKNKFDLPSIIDTNKFNITDCIVAGKRIPTTKPGTTICIKKIPVTSANHMKSTLGAKYKDIIYYPEVEMLILHDRLED